MSYMNQSDFAPACGIQELSFAEIDFVAAADLDLREAGSIIMAGGAIAAGVGVATGNPIAVGGGAVIGAVGGVVYIAGVFLQDN